MQRSRIDLNLHHTLEMNAQVGKHLLSKISNSLESKPGREHLGDDTAPSPLGYLNIAIIANSVQCHSLAVMPLSSMT